VTFGGVSISISHFRKMFWVASLLFSSFFVNGEYINGTLEAGKPLVGSVSSGTYTHYRFDFNSANKDLDITLTPIGEGDADLFVNFDKDGYPTTSSYDSKSDSRDRDAVHVPYKAGISQVRISVYGYRQNARFSIVATFNDVIALLDNVPQEGSLQTHQTRAYTFSVGTASEASFSYANLEGSTRMYVSNQVINKDDPSTYQYKSWLIFHFRYVVHKGDESRWPTGDNPVFHVLMEGQSDCRYRLTGKTNDEKHDVLTVGISKNDKVDNHETNYYKLQVDNSGCKIKLQLTPLSGDPNLYVSRNHDFPNATTATWKSSNAGLSPDAVSIDTSIGVYYIAVEGADTNSTYTILASSSCSGRENQTKAIVLNDGIPMQGSVDDDEFLLYSFRSTKFTNGTDEITFSLTAYAGNPNMYIKRSYFTDDAEAEATSEDYGSDFYSIKEGTELFCVDCTYYVLVIGETNASYSLTASTGRIILQDGVTIEEDIGSHNWEYFALIVDGTNSDLTIVVTDLASGDPDLYVSTTNPKPDKKNFEYKEESIGADALTIPGAASGTTYYIGVYAFTPTHFSIVATWGKPTELVDGQPQGGKVPKHGMAYYTYTTYSPGETISISASSSLGLVSLYVSETEKPIRGNSSTYQFYRSFSIASKLIEIPGGENPHCSAGTCKIYIGFFGITKSEFSITASSTKSTVRLQPGIPIDSSIAAKKYSYFRVPVVANNESLSIIVTPISGDPDLYVSRKYIFPNRTQPHPDPTMESRARGVDSIYIYPAEKGTYYIGVYGYSASRFKIVASLEIVNQTSSNATINGPTLLDGQPQGYRLHSHQWVYFRYIVTEPTQEVSIATSNVVGDPDLYVGKDFRPTRTHYTSRSTRYGMDLVALRNPEPATYFIGIYAYHPSKFVIMASSQNISRVLQIGTPIREIVNKHEKIYFEYRPISFASDISFILTPFSGDPDLKVTLGNLTMDSHGYLEDSVTFSHTEIASICANLVDCSFTAEVYGYTVSDFSISVSTQNTTVLQDGIPQDGFTAHKNQMAYFVFECPPGKDVNVIVTPQRGFVALYANRGETVPHDKNSAEFVSDQKDSAVQILQFQAGTCEGTKDASSCVFTIGVKGTSRLDNFTQTSTFSIIARTEDHVTQLSFGTPVRGWASAKSELFYRVDVPTSSVELVVQVTKITGDPDVYISTKTHKPNRREFEWRGLHIGSDAVVIPNANATTYYIGVYGFVNTSYTVMVSLYTNDTSEVHTLVPGQPQSGVVARGQTIHYLYQQAVSGQQLTFALTTNVGDPDLNVTLLGTGKNFIRRKYGEDVLELDDAMIGTYAVDIVGYSDSIYTLSVVSTENEGGALLIEGEPVNGVLHKSAYDYFYINIDNIAHDFTVIVTSYDGDPDLFVSNVPSPGLSNYNYSARLFGDDSVTIPREHLTPGKYYLSVYAPLGNCTYSIVASFGDRISLPDGVPIGGNLKTGAGTYYIYQSPHKHYALHFTLTILQGSADIYIANAKNDTPPVPWDSTTYDWRSFSLTKTSTVDILESDENYSPGDAFVVLVHSFRNCSYTLTASSSEAIIKLQSGTMVLQRGLDNAVGTVMFEFLMVHPDHNLEIAATPISGMVLSVRATTIRGGNDSWTWEYQTQGASTVLDIPASRTIATTYYIGVKCTAGARFGITAYSYNPNDDDQEGTVLVNRLPQIGVAPYYQGKYYRFFLNNFEDITISVTPRYGNPDIYITLDGTVPSPNHYKMKADSSGADELTLKATELPLQCWNSFLTCEVRIVVIGTSQTLFSITASALNAITFVEPGQTYTGLVEVHEYREFVTRVDMAAQLYVEVLPVSDGDPDLYVASFPHPNRTHYEARNMNLGRDSVVVNATTGFYYISIYGYSKTTFKLTVSLESTPVVLVGGQLQNGYVQAHHTRSFIYHIHRTEQDHDTTLVLHGFDGSAVMYVAANVTHPTGTEYQYTSAVAASGKQRGVISIPSTDHRACANCTLYISVYGNQDTLFSLLGNSGGYSLLVFGQPLRGSLHGALVVWYKFLVDRNDTDVSIVVTTFSGSVDIYAAAEDYSTQPSWAKHQYKSRGGAGVYQAIDIPKAPVGTYYVGIYPQASIADSQSQFSITATADNVLLLVGSPQSGVLSRRGSLFFCHIATENDVVFNIQPADHKQNFLFQVFVSTNTSAPNKENNDFSKIIEHGEPFRIPTTERKSCQTLYSQVDSCILYINVVPYSAADAGKAFTITATTSESVSVLIDKQLVKDTLVTWKYYESFVSKDVDIFLVELDPCYGNSDLYVDFEAVKPSQNSAWKSANKDDRDSLRITSKKLFGTSFYVGVTLADGAKEGKYQLRSSQFRQNESPVTVAPSDPTLRVKTTTTGARVEFSTAGIEKAQHLSLFWYPTFEDQGLVPYTACGLLEGYKRFKDKFMKRTQTFYDGGKYMELDMDNLYSGTTYTVGLLVHLVNSTTEYAVYRPSLYTHSGEIPIPDNTSNGPSDSSSTTLMIVLGVGIPLFLVSVLAIIYLSIRNRQLSQELEVELPDIAVQLGGEVVGSQTGHTYAGAQKDKYTRLLNEVNDDDDLVQEPPDFKGRSGPTHTVDDDEDDDFDLEPEV